MKITIIRHGKVDMTWDKKYNSAAYDSACAQYDQSPILYNGFYMRVLIRELKKQGYQIKKTSILGISNLDTVIAVKSG